MNQLLTPQEAFQLHSGLVPEGHEPGKTDPSYPLEQNALGRPRPPQYPPGADEHRNYDSYYRPFWRIKPWDIDLSGTPAAGARVLPTNQPDSLLRFPARSVIVDNLSGYSFLIYAGAERVFVGPAVYNLIRPLPDVLGELSIYVYGAAAAGPCIFTFTEEPLTPNAGTPSTAGGTAASVNVAQIGGAAISLGQKTMPASIPVAIASDQSPVPISTSGPLAVNPSASTGNANLGSGTTTLPGAVAASRPTRGVLFVRSRSSNNASGITFPGGAILFPGDAISLGFTGTFTPTGTAGDVLDWWETYG